MNPRRASRTQANGAGTRARAGTWRALRGAVAIVAAAALALDQVACDEAPPAAVRGPGPGQAWPPGTVLAVEGMPITADEVDLASAHFQRVQASATGPQLRRLALTNFALPRAVSRLLAAEAREKAKREADDLYARLVGKITDVGPDLDPSAGAERVTGTWQELGVVPWGTALELPEGRWSEPIEDVGQWIVLRRVGTREAPVSLATEVTIEAFAFPWMPPEERLLAIESAYDSMRLEIVDPAWEEIVPEHTLYRMGARRP